ncbi:MAG: hypothetical protein HY080_16415 [Gammaproteobacteria bacterium]|nr:hypothetical protein [Gammaproteobacteria bacterium]
MIKYKYDGELLFAKYYANKLKDTKAMEIIESGVVKNIEEAQYLSNYFWRMVDSAIEDEKQEIRLPWGESAEFWTEKLMYSISGYLERSGYEEAWENEADKQ